MSVILPPTDSGMMFVRSRRKNQVLRMTGRSLILPIIVRIKNTMETTYKKLDMYIAVLRAFVALLISTPVAEM